MTVSYPHEFSWKGFDMILEIYTRLKQQGKLTACPVKKGVKRIALV
jgi:hypothetical protein